ncbi:hypothetical protein R4282_20580 [Rhodococcus oxybenzonivorans]|uniref:hypothetical protein n=1 Tax=Rhodococcus oxybenzonivorans TaxID=1990687 RepID=UPI0029557872|nr:hypothetical protein [Rhodococcus oxybenzonivorans]MDV7355393.1 hypothetical protein [Rhodococcus oxybenzonivorans]
MPSLDASGTGLPVIVAVTGVAVESGDMTAANASVLVAAGATDSAATSDDKRRS